MKRDQDIGRIRDHLQHRSSQLFGKKHRLEIAGLAGALAPPIWSRRLARNLDIGENQAASELAEFLALGALKEFPSEFDRRKLYVAAPHYLWSMTRKALEEEIRGIDLENGDDLVARYWTAVLGGEQPQSIPVGGIPS